MCRAALPLTGERTGPDRLEENYWFRRHEAAYRALESFAAGQIVLEVGCGEGYGTDGLAATADRVIGLDYDAAAVSHASARYPRPSFVRANLAALPVRPAAVDAVFALQVIEHVWHHGEFLAECGRVLRPGGALVLSTPNRLTFSPGLDRPANPFHTREFTGTELAALLAGNGFRVEHMWGLHAGARLAEWDTESGGEGAFVATQLAAPPDQWSPSLRSAVAAVSIGDFVVRRGGEDLDASLDLIVVARAA